MCSALPGNCHTPRPVHALDRVRRYCGEIPEYVLRSLLSFSISCCCGLPFIAPPPMGVTDTGRWVPAGASLPLSPTPIVDRMDLVIIVVCLLRAHNCILRVVEHTVMRKIWFPAVGSAHRGQLGYCAGVHSTWPVLDVLSERDGDGLSSPVAPSCTPYWASTVCPQSLAPGCILSRRH